MSAERLQDNGLCFGCGANNTSGLHLTFEWHGDSCCALWTPAQEHQGWADRVHGGLLALVLDEAMTQAALERHGQNWVTAELTTRLKSPALLDEPLQVEARIVSVRPRLILCTGEVRAETGKRLVATGTAKLMRPSECRRLEYFMADSPYRVEGETPLEASVRAEAEDELGAAQTRREELEADRLVGDIDTYVAETDPASLPEAEQALNDWEIPTDPLEGVPDSFAIAPGIEGQPLVSVFAAKNEAEANIVRGVLEASGIPVAFDGLPSPTLGSVFQAGETRWADLLVPAGQADEARAAIAESVSSASA